MLPLSLLPALCGSAPAADPYPGGAPPTVLVGRVDAVADVDPAWTTVIPL